MGNTPVLVDNPQNVAFDNHDALETPIQIGSLADGTTPVPFTTSSVDWSDTSKRFVNTGSAIDHL